MRGLLGADGPAGGGAAAPEGWPRAAGRILVACMLLLGAAAAWLILTRPVHRIEGDFLLREDRRLVDPWLQGQLRQPVAELRARAHRALARIQGPDSLDALARALQDPAPSVRAAAAFAVGCILDARSGDPRALPATAALVGLLEDEERLVATRAVEALGKMGWQSAAEALTRTAAPIPTAMTALVRLEGREQGDFVAEYLDSDDQDSRWAASLAVAELGLAQSPLARKRLRKLVVDDNEFVRAAALRAAAGSEPDADMLADIRANLEHADPKVRYEAARTLDILDGAAAQPDLPAGEPAFDFAPRPAPARPLFETADYQRIAKTLGVRLRLETSLGSFEIELDYDLAPLTAEHFRRRAEQGALDGIAFSAVRPNGYAVAAAPNLGAIRSELNPKPFLRGSLGLLRLGGASGGGFFLCLTPLPLADGRYVNFGRLVSGDRLLDSISEGTVVQSVRGD